MEKIGVPLEDPKDKEKGAEVVDSEEQTKPETEEGP
jgi:hypothetical protein